MRSFEDVVGNFPVVIINDGHLPLPKYLELKSDPTILQLF